MLLFTLDGTYDGVSGAVKLTKRYVSHNVRASNHLRSHLRCDAVLTSLTSVPVAHRSQSS